MKKKKLLNCMIRLRISDAMEKELKKRINNSKWRYRLSAFIRHVLEQFLMKKQLKDKIPDY